MLGASLISPCLVYFFKQGPGPRSEERPFQSEKENLNRTEGRGGGGVFKVSPGHLTDQRIVTLGFL